jgi:hypothetical protein
MSFSNSSGSNPDLARTSSTYTTVQISSVIRDNLGERRTIMSQAFAEMEPRNNAEDDRGQQAKGGRDDLASEERPFDEGPGKTARS